MTQGKNSKEVFCKKIPVYLVVPNFFKHFNIYFKYMGAETNIISDYCHIKTLEITLGECRLMVKPYAF